MSTKAIENMFVLSQMSDAQLERVVKASKGMKPLTAEERAANEQARKALEERKKYRPCANPHGCPAPGVHRISRQGVLCETHAAPLLASGFVPLAEVTK